MRERMVWLAALIGAVSLISLFGILFPWITHALALIPRESIGLVGIIGMPFVHGSLAHLLSNLPPLAILAALVVMRGGFRFALVTAAILLLGGIGLWIFGQAGFHVGASLLVFGYFGYLLAEGYIVREAVPLLIAISVALVYGGMLWGVLPNQPGVSWDGHLAGLAAGIVSAQLLHGQRKT